MSDTPETDSKASPHIGFYSCATVPANFARALEQERDEAREELATLCREKCRDQRERDEARQQYDDLATEHVLAVSVGKNPNEIHQNFANYNHKRLRCA